MIIIGTAVRNKVAWITLSPSCHIFHTIVRHWMA